MKRTISLWLGLLAFALLPVLAQTPAAPAIKGPTGSIHGAITGPEGAPRTSGSVSLSTDDGHTNKFTFQVSPSGTYAGTATPGTYKVVYRAADTPPDKFVDSFDKVKILADQDVLQDFDMSRKEFIEKNLTVEQRKELEELKKKNADILKTNDVIKNLNADLKLTSQDFKDADNALETAKQVLGATASKPDIDAKAIEIKTAKYTEAETLMLKDTAAKPDASIIWAQLGQAQLGLAQLVPLDDRPAKYAQAESTYKKVLDLEAASKKPSPQAQGAANQGLGEIYARTGKIPESQAAYDAAAKTNPAQAGLYFKNEAVIFYQVGNADAQVAAADEAIKANEANKVDPAISAIPYYLKGQGLVQNATIDPKTKLYVLPPGCAEAYQMYLKLAPTGPFANDAKGILAQAAGTNAPKK